jgi:hypothetical protein
LSHVYGWGWGINLLAILDVVGIGKVYGVGCSNDDYYLLNQDIIKVILKITISLSFTFIVKFCFHS